MVIVVLCRSAIETIVQKEPGAFLTLVNLVETHLCDFIALVTSEKIPLILREQSLSYLAEPLSITMGFLDTLCQIKGQPLSWKSADHISVAPGQSDFNVWETLSTLLIRLLLQTLEFADKHVIVAQHVCFCIANTENLIDSVWEFQLPTNCSGESSRKTFTLTSFTLTRV